MADRHSTFFFCDLHQSFCNHRPCNRGSQQILSFIDCTGLQGGKDKVIDKFLLKVFYVYFAGPGFNCLFLEGFQFFPLAYITGYGNDFIVIVFLEPGYDDGSIQSSGIGKNYLLFLRHTFHLSFLISNPVKPEIH